MRRLVRLQERLDLEVQRAASPRASGASTTRQVRDRPDQEPRDGLGGPAGRRQPDAGRVGRGPAGEPLERDREVGPALVRDQRMDLVDDQVPDALARSSCQAGWLSSSERLSGVVIRRCGGSSRSFRRWCAEVSPVRTPTETGLFASPRPRRIASSGSERFRSMS